MEEKPEVKIDEKLKSKNDGRKKAWWVKKIDLLEKELEVFRSNSQVTSPSGDTAIIDNASFAEGYIACMNKHQILTKAIRNKLKTRLIQNGPGEIKNMSSPKFRGLVL